ncbi:hypothetical protein CGLO_18056 [Colletotrichum gloeosporioides Cg-14]|uniref:Uncharacterized protein n=1 Tax=Colletotrichum gloeosporioides (strain Cg-14) TaxID=1237896 RepID=T0JV73_COLGC|nr:hypothetical protein CGLO_18056 [Colletotrichum gloeosporioides Cg-14]
MSKDKRYG